MKNHPNAVTALVTGLAATGIVWLAHKEGWTIESYYATGIATTAVTTVLALGRKSCQLIGSIGLIGILKRILWGNR